MITLQELRAWHIKCATSALGQARIRIGHLEAGSDLAVSIQNVAQIVGQVEFHLQAAELLALAINGG
jgi:hypothetical protein